MALESGINTAIDQSMILSILTLLFSVSSHATTLTSGISGFEISHNGVVPHLVFFESGKVGKISPDDIAQLVVVSSRWMGEKFEIQLDPDRRIIKMKSIVVEQVPLDFWSLPTGHDYNYEPTVLPNNGEATTIFNRLNPYARSRSECYNRAHVWTYEEFRRVQLQSMKVFLFFTSKYIWDYDWDWWFHVSPYVWVRENNLTVERVIDYQFMMGPVDMKKWTDYFIIPKVECPSVGKYSDYEKHQKEQYCYLIKKPMYYWQPRDIQNLERTGKEKTSYIPDEVSHAYWQGF